jgi:hypothetical protein
MAQEEGVNSLFAPAARKGSAAKNGPTTPKAQPAGSKTPVSSSSPPASAVSARRGSSAEELSRKYKEANKLDYADRIEDGFCDFIAEKVVISREEDGNFDAFMARAQKKLQKAADPVTAMMVLALFLSEFSGRSGAHATGVQDRFAARLRERTRQDGTILLGCLLAEQPGKTKKNKVQGCCLVRHRALAFKAAADRLRVPAALLERDQEKMVAWNVVQISQVAYVVDLVHDPGALYEIGTPKHEEYVRLLALGQSDGHTTNTISSREELEGHVPRPPWHVEARAVPHHLNPAYVGLCSA